MPMDKKIDGGFALVKTLKELNVKDIFTLAGGHINPIYNACKELGIRLIDTHHEQGASMAAMHMEELHENQEFV